MSIKDKTQTDVVCLYIEGTRDRHFPKEVLDEAKKCLVDWAAVCIGAYQAPEARIVHDVLRSWNCQGNARLLRGESASPAIAAMINATLSHCLDFDDTHIPSVIHVSGPLWAAILAVGSDRGTDEKLLLKAFITGFEVATRIGDKNVGIRLNNNGWHATPALAGIAVAAALAVLLNLTRDKIAHALGIAATQASGLTASFGTMSKPFQVGKTAMNGVLAAELASAGLSGAPGILDTRSSFVHTLLQDNELRLELSPFDDVWEITRNGFKPYAACQLTHAAIDAARLATTAVKDKNVERIRAFVNPLTLKIADVRNPVTLTEAKFSLAYCVALGLSGYTAGVNDFDLERVQNPALAQLASKLEAIPDEAISRTSARLEIHIGGAEPLIFEVENAVGSIGNPLGWQELDDKFKGLVTPAIGDAANELLEVLHRFEERGSLKKLFEFSSRNSLSLR